MPQIPRATALSADSEPGLDSAALHTVTVCALHRIIIIIIIIMQPGGSPATVGLQRLVLLSAF